jgi:hypothetical protein
MKTVSVLLTVLTVLMFGSTLLCGFWLRAKGADAEGVRFHVTIALATAALTVGSLVALVVSAFRS